METNLKGMGVALVTPFLENGSIDYSSLQKLVEYNLKNGTDYLVVQGTTGESPVLTSEEKRAVLDFVLEINGGKVPVVYGIGGNNTAAVCEELKTFDAKGVCAILSASPYYNKPTQEGIYQHFKAMDACTPLPIILYNVPGRTSSNLTAETTLRLARDCANIIAIKEASGDLNQVMTILRDRPNGFLVISGDDAITLPFIALGGDGVISVVGQAFPESFSRMVHAALDGDFETSREDHYRLLEITRWLFVEGNPAGVKEVLRLLNICQANLRLPLTPVSEATARQLYQLVAESELVKI